MAPLTPITDANCKFNINGNGKDTILDISAAAGHFGQKIGSPGWYPIGPLADVDADGAVTIPT